MGSWAMESREVGDSKRLGLWLALGVLFLVVLAIVIIRPSKAVEWEALGTGTTALVALFAGMIAVDQLREARKTREEQAQPYVAIALEPVPIIGAGLADLVVRNFGSTAALNVTLDFGNEMPVAYLGREGGENLWLPASIPTLVPGQEWRTLWDSASSRAEAEGAANSHTVAVGFSDSKGKPYSLTFTLDWEPVSHRATAHVYGAHEGAKALREIAKTHKRWTESHVRGGLSVTARDGHRRDADARKALKAPLWWKPETWPRRKRLADAARARWLRAKQRAPFVG